MKSIHNKFLVMKLSDKILLIFFIFSSIALFFIWTMVETTWQQLFVLICIVYITTFVFTFFVSRRFSRDLISLAFKVEEMAAGNFAKRLETKKKDEIGQLVNSVNELMARLQTGLAQDAYKQREIHHAKSDFVALAAHQLRTPLSIVKWYSDYLLSGDAGKFNKEQNKYIAEIFHSNQRLIDLVNALLDASRIDLGTFSIDPEPTDVIERAEKAVDRYTRDIEKKKIKFETQFDKFDKINLDPRLTRMIFENLLSNAIKYTPEGGKISVTVKKTEKNILIKVADSGCGIPREQQPKIFTKLFRADNAKKIESDGNGLGLYIVKAIVDKSGGKIWFESPSLELLLDKDHPDGDIPIDKKSAGTTFFITLPLKGMHPKKGTKQLESIA